MKLTIIGLPLGNIQDISLRAIQNLSIAKLIICEDTRVFHKLWQKLINLELLDHKFSGKLITLNDFNEKTKILPILNQLQQVGEGVLISDAGLPLISDPGYSLVNLVLENNGEIDVIPGPTAAMSSLAVSGFSADKVLFLGFLPKKSGKRQKQLELIKRLHTGLTVIFYESPHRLKKTISQLKDNFPGGTQVAVIRELTKKHQEIIRGTLQDIDQKLPEKIKGEVTLLLRVQ